MKLEDLLMDRTTEQKQKQKKKKHTTTTVNLLEMEVVKLQEELEGEQTLNSALQCAAFHGSISAHPSSSSLLPPKVEKLISELAMVEEEIVWLERKVEEMNLRLHQERIQNQHWQKMLLHSKIRRRRHKHPTTANHVLCAAGAEEPRWHVARTNTNTTTTDHSADNDDYKLEDSDEKKPNELSEELIKCLIGVFLQLNLQQQPYSGQHHHRPTNNSMPKLALACMNSIGKTTSLTLSCRIPPPPHSSSSSSSINTSSSTSSNHLDPYAIFPDSDWTTASSCFRDIGPYKNCIHITRNSLDITRFPDLVQAIRKLRDLMHKLCNVDLTFLTYKQKLAFWINIYNACIMHAFLEHGLPSSQDKLLDLMNKAALNVGGIVLNALAIEHFILRHPYDLKHGLMDEKEKLLRHAYGLGFPEPNITFALCRGSRSSPALRVYTAEEVVNELGKAKVEYLEAAVGITSKRKILVPKLLKWHMRDFADDMDSLVEWIYSQLPRSGSLKGLMMECFNCEPNSSSDINIVDIQPYEFDFRYLLALS